MPNSIFRTMLSRYQIATKDDLTNATHEVMQEITPAKPHFHLIQNKTTSVANNATQQTSLPH